MYLVHSTIHVSRILNVELSIMSKLIMSSTWNVDRHTGTFFKPLNVYIKYIQNSLVPLIRFQFCYTPIPGPSAAFSLPHNTTLPTLDAMLDPNRVFLTSKWPRNSWTHNLAVGAAFNTLEAREARSNHSSTIIEHQTKQSTMHNVSV